MNFLTNIVPDCDCLPYSDTAMVGDIGILASCDPVALDQATVDLINAQPGNQTSRMNKKGLAENGDKFRAVWDIDYTIQLKYAEEIGLGSRAYDLKMI